ncbi:glycosyltransferase family 4 protein [Winogradskyella sp.]|nr:glycosyltransferase family 4 protein [Winogradskyella sp.]
MKSKVIFIAKLFSVLFRFVLYRTLFFLRIKNVNNILLIPQNTHIGGTKTFFYNLCEYLLSRHYNIAVLVNKIECSEELFEYLKEKNITIFQYNNELDYLEYWYPWKHSLKKYFLLDFLKQSSFILNIASQHKVRKIIVSSAYPSSLFPAFLIPVPVFYFIHSMPWGKIDPGKKRILDHILKHYTNKHLITVSKYSQDRISTYWAIDKSKIKVIYNSSPVVKGLIPKENNDVITILTLGNVLSVKNPELWVNIAKELCSQSGEKRLNFIWAGSGELLEEMQIKTKQFKNINFIGYTENTRALFENADIYFQPSKWESHGLAVVEAMSYGLPCVVTNNGGTTESIINNESGYTVDVDNYNEMLQKLLLLVNNKELRKKLGDCAMERHYHNFSQDVWYTNLDNIIHYE